jgi:uncharacterized protein (UPF0332 family)
MAIPDHEHLLDQANSLINRRRPGPARQVDIRRSISAAYYALFHFIMAQAADSMIGSTRRRDPRYSVVYRSVDHAQLRSVCQAIRSATPDQRVVALAPQQGFGEPMRSFAAMVQELQARRHTADYDPAKNFSEIDAVHAILGAHSALRFYQAAPAEERAAFLTLLLFKRR